MYLYWYHYWHSHNEQTELYHWVPNVFSIPDYFLPQQSLVQIITGHGRFTFYLYCFGLAQHSLGPCGKDCMTFMHYLTHCS